MLARFTLEAHADGAEMKLDLLRVAGMVLVSAFAVDAGAQDARPIRFWSQVTDFSQTKPRTQQYRLENAMIPTPLVGWTCRSTAPNVYEVPAGEIRSGVVGQRGTVTCSSKAGSVAATAMCAFSSARSNDEAHATISDLAGHTAWIGVACASR
jgi:hypothetical protein